MSVNVKRIYWADTLKGLLIVLVVLGHAITNYTSVAQVPFWNKLCDAIYAFHMPAFFVISGYLHAISGKDQNSHNVVRRKILSLGIPMVIFSTLYWFVKFVAAQFGGGIIMNPQGISTLLLMFINPIGEYWFLYALLLITVADIYFNKAKMRLGVQVAIWFVLLLAVNYIPKELPFFWESIVPRVFKHGFYFLMGKLIFVKIEKYLKRPPVIAGVATVAVVSWICWYAVDGFTQYALPKLILAGATTLLLIIILSGCGSSLIGRLGKASLDVYLLHPYFIVACKMILTRFIPNAGLYFILSTAISIALCYAAIFVVSKIKYLDFIFRPLKYIK